ERLLKSNIRYFDRHLPGVAAFVRGVGQPLSKIVWQDDRAVDIYLGRGLLYKKPVDDFVREQIDAYFQNPERVILNRPEGVNMKSHYAIEMLGHLMKSVYQERKLSLMGQSKDTVGFLLVLGVGLGFHIEPLIER